MVLVDNEIGQLTPLTYTISIRSETREIFSILLLLPSIKAHYGKRHDMNMQIKK